MHQIALASYLPTIKSAANFDKRGDFDNDCYFINTNTLPSYSSIFRLIYIFNLHDGKSTQKMFSMVLVAV